MQQQVSSSPALLGAAVVIVATNADERRAHCAWCWKRQHPHGEPYPREWSSTICEACESEMQADIARVKAKLAAARAAREAQS